MERNGGALISITHEELVSEMQKHGFDVSPEVETAEYRASFIRETKSGRCPKVAGSTHVMLICR